MSLVSRGKVGQLGYFGDIVTGPFICLGTKRKAEWSIQDQQREGNQQDQHAQLVKDRVEKLVRQLEGLSSVQPGCLVKPLGLPSPAAGGLEGLARVGKGLDTVWVRDCFFFSLSYFHSFLGGSQHDSFGDSKAGRVDRGWWNTSDGDTSLSLTGNSSVII